MTAPLLVRLGAQDRALMLRCAISPAAPRASRVGWAAITHLGGTGVSVAAAGLPWLGPAASSVRRGGARDRDPRDLPSPGATGQANRRTGTALDARRPRARRSGSRTASPSRPATPPPASPSPCPTRWCFRSGPVRCCCSPCWWDSPGFGSGCTIPATSGGAAHRDRHHDRRSRALLIRLSPACWRSSGT